LRWTSRKTQRYENKPHCQWSRLAWGYSYWKRESAWPTRLWFCYGWNTHQ
jgi:hypothetical protein